MKIKIKIKNYIKSKSSNYINNKLIIYKILKNENITALMVTHDISEAISMSDRIVVLSHRPATVKNIYNIDFEIENRTPLNCRESPKFSQYFNLLWKELEESKQVSQI